MIVREILDCKAIASVFVTSSDPTFKYTLGEELVVNINFDGEATYLTPIESLIELEPTAPAEKQVAHIEEKLTDLDITWIVYSPIGTDYWIASQFSSENLTVNENLAVEKPCPHCHKLPSDPIE